MVDRTQLSLVRANADLTKIEATPHKKTLAFVNHFVTHTVHFLNRFSGVCEEKLMDISYRIQRLEITMNILEAKLNSIPGLEGVTADQYVSPHANDGAGAQVPITTSSSTSAPPSNAPPPPANAPPPPNAAGPSAPALPAAAAAPEPASTNTVANDPRYAKFLKLVRLGVPPAQIAMKMKAEGLDPALLETPDALVPPDASGTASSKGDDSDKDDDDDDNDNDGFGDSDEDNDSDFD